MHSITFIFLFLYLNFYINYGIIYYGNQNAAVAQLVEQLIRNQ